MVLIWTVTFRLRKGTITFRNQSEGNSIQEILAVLDIIFCEFEYKENAVLESFEYIVRFLN